MLYSENAVSSRFCWVKKPVYFKVKAIGIKLHTLHSIGISGCLLKWFENYLSNRQQRVIINRTVSSYLKGPAGVSQGSLLEPLLFLIYINDIVLELNRCIRLFDVDTSLYIVVENPNAAAALLNSSLHTIHSWAKYCLVDFNPRKNRRNGLFLEKS